MAVNSSTMNYKPIVRESITSITSVAYNPELNGRAEDVTGLTSKASE